MKGYKVCIKKRMNINASELIRKLENITLYHVGYNNAETLWRKEDVLNVIKAMRP
jgi:hypothetical protein